jgi:ribosomal protein L37E
MKKEKKCIHVWKVICAMCCVEDGDDVLECERCGEESYRKTKFKKVLK